MRSIRWMPAPIEARVQRWRERSREEYRRLLYVGMTRAKDRLYLAGISKTTRTDDRRWHALVTRALEAEWREVRGANGAITEYEWRPSERTVATAEQDPDAARAIEVPDWARQNVDAPPERRRTTPSGLGGSDRDTESLPRAVAARIAAAREEAAVRGRLVHRLLESLPELPPDHRAPVGEAYLGAFASELDEEERGELLREVLAVMADPRFAPVFAPGSRAEVDIAGRVTMADGEVEVSGRIDRLAVTESRVLVVDYKTNRPAPKAFGEVPDAYVSQLALYRLLLGRLYPGRTIAAALLWTDRAALMELPAGMLDAAESRILTGNLAAMRAARASDAEAAAG
jgi:ATP-dependent helicase/nuclease subunit A